MKLKREEVYDIINEERKYQDNKWGGILHDESHSLSDWLTYIRKYLTDADNGLFINDEKKILSAIRKLTALGVVVMELHGVPKRSEENDN